MQLFQNKLVVILMIWFVTSLVVFSVPLSSAQQDKNNYNKTTEKNSVSFLSQKNQ